MTALVVPAVLLLAVAWAALVVRRLRTLPEGRPADPGRSLAVVVPARDEAASLPALLRSVAALSTPVDEVVVVDDDSRDGTAAVARAGGATVVPAGTPPPGWTGKAWACHVGVQATSAELLLFLDADTELAPDAVARLQELREGYRGGLVSVQPFHLVVRPYEQLSAHFNAVAVLASGAFGRRPARRPMAFGPCLLTSRADYDRAGGHAAVRGEVLDDVRLAAAYDCAGLPVVCAVGGRSVRMRSYPGGFRQLADGWTKNFASGAAAAAPGPALGAAAWVGAHHAVAVGAALALADAAAGGGVPGAHGPLALWALAWVAVAAQLRATLRATGSFRWWTWALFPAPLLVFDLVFARSAARTLVRRSVRWRGREVLLGRRGRSAGSGA